VIRFELGQPRTPWFYTSAVSDGYWDDLARHTLQDEIWMSHPLARARINERVSGNREVWPTTWLKQQLEPRGILARTLSVGCGIGNLERDLAAQGVIHTATGIDLSETCILEASRLAQEAGLGQRLQYKRADARAVLSDASGLDAVFFHSALHHFDDHDELLGMVRSALAPGGILYIDEYVGPSRDEWRPIDLALPNIVYRTLPAELRRVRIVRAPINRDDPTEAVESSRIVAALEHTFPDVQRRDYGGNLLSLLYPNMNREGPGEEFRERLGAAVTYLLDLEEFILRHGTLLRAKTFFTAALATA